MRTKTDNHPRAAKAKVELRRRVLEVVKPARVFDAFCGVGEMYRGAWHEAAEYVGCDERPWSPDHPPRFVADNERLMRCLDLSRFNVFDFDSYGSPWNQMEILLHRRPWKKREVGAVVITDGSSLNLRWGKIPPSIARLTGVGQGLPTVAANEDLQSLTITRWLAKAKVKSLQSWQAKSKSSTRVVYTAVVFEGTG